MMVKKHAKKIQEAVTDLKIATPNQIMGWIERHYPSDGVNRNSYRADIMGCSVNHTSSRHYPSMPKFLWFNDETKKYRLATPDELKEYGKKASPLTKVDNGSSYIDGIPVSKLSVTGQVTIPQKIQEKMDFQHGDTLAFIINEKGILELRKAKIRLDLV